MGANKMCRLARVFLAGTATLSIPGSALSQWNFSNLHPGGASYSILWSVWGGKQVGEVAVDGQTHAALWSGTKSSFVDLHPEGATFSRANGVYGGQQVGFVRYDGRERAILWNGSSTGSVDMHPANAGESILYGIYENQQVGQIDAGAARWSGTRQSATLLSPGAIRAQSTYGGMHVGYGHGGLNFWGEGFLGSYTEHQRGLGIHGYQIVGHKSGHPFATLWTYNGAWYDLVPTGSDESMAFDVHAGVQAGMAGFAGKNRACVWFSTKESYHDLHQYLPTEYTNSRAHAIWHDRDGIAYVVGYGSNSQTKRDEAIMWVSSPPAGSIGPSAVAIVRGQVTSGSSASLNASDDERLVLRPGITFTTGDSPIVIEAEFTMPAQLPGSLLSVFESRASSPAVEQLVEVYNYAENGFNRHDQQRITISDRDILTGINPMTRFVSPEGKVRMRISYRVVAPVFVYPWSIAADQLVLRYR